MKLTWYDIGQGYVNVNYFIQMDIVEHSEFVCFLKK